MKPYDCVQKSIKKQQHKKLNINVQEFPNLVA